MRIISLVFFATLALGLGGCSKGDSSSTPASSSGSEPSAPKDSTSLDINLDKGSVSYDSAEGDNKTSISVGDSNDKK